MPPGPEEISRRIKAARELRGIEQTELSEQLAADGLGKSEAGRIERGDLPLTRVRREALMRRLGVPERWFTSDSVDEIVGLDGDDHISAVDRLAAIDEKLERLLAQRKAAQERLSRIAPEEAEDALEMLTELRSLAARVGREVPKRGAQARAAADRQQRRAANGGG